VASSRCGLGLVLAGDDGWDYVYCHASELLGGGGEAVSAGQVLGRSGSTGHATGPHLHFGIQHPDGEQLCPHRVLATWLGVEVPPLAGCVSN
jgi:murein DD-endopeptidase MepM/ murein hydrolase activator NlpD